MLKLLLSSIITVFLLLGCSTVVSLKTDNTDKEYAPTDASVIKVFSTADAGRSYEILGEIVAMADVGESSTAIVHKIKVAAAKFGADAIINLRLDFGMGYWETGLKGSATAVKFK